MKVVKVLNSKNAKIEIKKTDIVPDFYKSVLVVINRQKEWLMVKNKFRSWEFPGGHKEGEETIIETAKREAFEEAGAEIKNVVYVGYYRLSNGHTTLIVKAEIEKLHEIPVDFETEERGFFSEFPQALSFKDEVYPWLIRHMC